MHSQLLPPNSQHYHITLVTEQIKSKPCIKITDGSDYRGATQTFVVNSGERRCITIEILDDSVVESQERLRVRLTARSFSVQYSSCYIYITDNDRK